jgi:hypothetical protein
MISLFEIATLSVRPTHLCKQLALKPSYHCEVKVISFILSLLILSMALLPCADEPVENHVVSVEMHDQHEASGQHDLCSPLCTCHCCHSHITQQALFCLKTFVSFSSTPVDRPFTLLFGISFSIWDRPPFYESNPIV